MELQIIFPSIIIIIFAFFLFLSISSQLSSLSSQLSSLCSHDVFFASRPVNLVSKFLSYDSTSIAFAPYGDYWRQLRKICITELLNNKRVQSFRSIGEEEVSNLTNMLASKVGSPVNLTDEVLGPPLVTNVKTKNYLISHQGNCSVRPRIPTCRSVSFH
ncbi:hypothetical protein ACOSP7_030196 [Xanthoceras sorbifolium]